MFLLPLIIAFILWKLRPVHRVRSLLLYQGQKPSMWHRAYLPFWLLVLASMLGMATFHHPTVSYTSHVPEATVPNLAIVLDLSGSMHAVDWPAGTPLPQHPTPDQLPPTRLQTAKSHILELLQDIPQARAALIAFADNTVLVSPLSSQHSFLKARLQTLTPELFQDGTAIGNALKAALDALAHAPSGPRTILLLSDGADHTRSQISPEAAARLAAQQGITIHTVAIGGQQALHPVSTDFGIRWENVGDALDRQQLTRIASITGGHMYEAPDARQLAQAVSRIQEHVYQQSQAFAVTQTMPLNPLLLTLATLIALCALLLRHHEPQHP